VTGKQPRSVLCHVIPPTLPRVADGQHYAGSVRCVCDAPLIRRYSVSVPADIDCAIIARETFPKVVLHCLIIPHMGTVMT